MFSSRKDFALLARQVALSSREAAAKENATTDLAVPFLVDVYQVRLWKLMHTPDKADVKTLAEAFHCNPQELLHTIVALYDKTLSEIGGETIYDTVCEPKVVTILVVKGDAEAQTEQNHDIHEMVTDENDCLDTLQEEIDDPDSVFHDVFSDAATTDSSDEDDDGSGSDDHERDYSIGLGKYLERVKAGKLNLHKRVIACLSFQKMTLFPLPTQEEHVLDLQLMACRKKFRGQGIGRHLIQLLMNRDYVGEFDAIVTASDQKAIDFYRKFGFTEDAILLSKYKDVGDCWTNTTKMCYLPPYNVVNDDPIRCLTSMDDQFQKWQKTMFSSYQNQAALFNRLKNEMIGLYAKINAQDQTILSLNRDRFLLAKENASLKSRLAQTSSGQGDRAEESEPLAAHQIIEDLEKMSLLNEKILVVQMSLLTDDDCSTQLAIQYCSHKLRDALNGDIKAKKVTMDAANIALYRSALASLQNGNQKNETLLFYSGHHEHLDIIANAGFTNEDFLYGSFGKGLYFHSNLTNARNPTPGKILLCKVALGRIELIAKSKTKSTMTLKRNTDFDSVKILDLDLIDDGDEIVIFDPHLALPLFIITLT